MFLKCTVQLLGVAGFYIARHPWLLAAGYVKVGFSSYVETRLEMASFKTCFTPEWSYYAVFECESSKEALLLEQSVLYLLADKRVPHRELLCSSEEEVEKIAQRVADKLNINCVHKRFPNYSLNDTTAADVLEGEEASPSSSLSTSDQEQGAEDYRGGEGLLHGVAAESHSVIVSPTSSSASPPTTAPLSKGSKAASTRVSSVPPKNEVVLTISSYLPQLDVVKRDLAIAAQLESSDGALAGDSYYVDKGAAAATASGVDEELVELSSSAFMLVDDEEYRLEKLRPYQQDAVKKVQAELWKSGKAICQMACRCGKTPVAFTILKDLLAREKTAKVLYLVPGLTLLRQTAKKLFDSGLHDVPTLLIGSDPQPVFLDHDHILTMTTDFLLIRGFIANQSHSVVLSTYHSSPLLKDLRAFSFIIFDECHRVCGSTEMTAFNTILLQPPQFNEKRLFLTATPTYDTPLKMSDEALFGSIAYRYYLREGIDAGYVNPFTVRIVLGPSFDDMNLYFFEAMRIVDKMLVFCRNIEHAEELYDKLVKTKLPADVDAFTVLVAHSRMGAPHVLKALRQFTESSRAILFNVRLFQEGVEIPDLNAVFFAAPRYSARDIIQSICRPLNKMPNKPKSYVFLPAVFDPSVAEDDPINLKNFSTLVPFTDALMDEDPKLFEYMIDPEKVDYDISVVGVRSMKLSSNQIHDVVLPAIRRGVRYSTRNVDRLHRAARMPWKPIFSEVRRIVLECNRYPKTNDAWVVGNNSISLNLFYRYIRKGYEAYMNGDHSYLQVYQVRDLESLPKWKQYGLHGPYPWKECMRTLEDYLARFGKAPPLDIHKGGYIGLDATPFERLSGCLMHVNQSDARSTMTLAPSKQVDMDRICTKYGLKWRKLRTKSGKLRKGQRTFVTESYLQFKHLFAAVKTNPAFQKYLDLHFPGYPHKHERMESLQVLSDGKVPPRHLPRSRRGRRGHAAASKQKKDEDNGGVVVKRGRGRPRKNIPSQQTQGKESSLPPQQQQQQSVMCRVCRVYVPVSKYKDHLMSKVHLRKQSALS